MSGCNSNLIHYGGGVLEEVRGALAAGAARGFEVPLLDGAGTLGAAAGGTAVGGFC